MLKKFIATILFILIGSSLFVSSPGFCADQSIRSGLEETAIEADIIKNADTYEEDEDLIFTAIITTVTKMIFPILTVILIIVVLYSGLLWMLDRGEGKNLERAKKMLIAVVIGYLLTILAYYLVRLVFIAIQKGFTG